MKSSELKTTHNVSNWLLSINTTANTERNYLQAIKAFCEITEKMPGEDILEAGQEIESGVLPRQRKNEKFIRIID